MGGGGGGGSSLLHVSEVCATVMTETIYNLIIYYRPFISDFEAKSKLAICECHRLTTVTLSLAPTGIQTRTVVRNSVVSVEIL